VEKVTQQVIQTFGLFSQESQLQGIVTNEAKGANLIQNQ
jgi:hypothetical protein